MKTQKFLYRYVLYYGYPGNKSDLFLQELPIIRYTPKGFWVEIHRNKTKWVSNFGRNRFAQPTEKEALKHFIRRKMYRNHCITEELERNNFILIVANSKLKKL